MSEVKRFYIMQCAVPVILDNTPAYTPMTNHKTELHSVPVVMASDFDALQQRCRERDAEASRLRTHKNEYMGAAEATQKALRAELATVKKVAYGNLELLDENTALRAEVENLRKDAERWIPVSERLPDEHKAEYLCLFDGGHQQVTEWLHDDTEGWVFWYGNPTHWRPLAAPPAMEAAQCADTAGDTPEA